MATKFQDLRTFQHCDKNVNLVCFNLPLTCPLCHQSTATTECRIPPYVLPSPFCSSLSSPHSVVLKPTHGDFIRNYERTCNLHIGVTDTNGLVYDFDEKGLNRGSVWSQCVSIMLDDNERSHSASQTKDWDQVLAAVSGQAMWDRECYDETNWNCFDFVLEFLKLFDRLGDSRFVYMSRQEFCDNFLVLKTRRVEQYIHLYRQAVLNGCVVVPVLRS